jgi:hypothetical protein
MSTLDSILYTGGMAGGLAGATSLALLAKMAKNKGGIGGYLKNHADGLTNMTTGAGGFMTGYSQSANTGNMLTGTLTGLATGGLVGGAIGLGSTILGGVFGRKKRKKNAQPEQKQFQQLTGPQDTEWSSKSYIRHAAEGGREGLPLNLGGSKAGLSATISSNTTINFARVEIVSSDARSAGSDFVSGLTEGSAKILASQLSAGPTGR